MSGFQGLESEASLDGFCLFLVARLRKEGEHVALIGFNSRLVEGVDAKNVAADTTGFLKEVDELSEVFFFKCGQMDEDVGYSSVDMRERWPGSACRRCS